MGKHAGQEFRQFLILSHIHLHLKINIVIVVVIIIIISLLLYFKLQLTIHCKKALAKNASIYTLSSRI